MNYKLLTSRVLFVLGIFLCVSLLAYPKAKSVTPYQKKTAKLMTTWGEALKATDPILNEYPRPQLVREKWLNLNGIWQFQPATDAEQALPSDGFNREILVPFPVESALSGIMEHYDHIWYRRNFTIPQNWSGQRILLHFGAVDYFSEVFVNGVSVGKHQGGYDPFYFDITDYISGTGEQQLAVRVTDETDAKGYPRGKQTLYPGGIMYTSVTGIWQTVWLEAVPQTYLASFKLVPDIDNGEIKFSPNIEGTVIPRLKYRFKIFDNNVEIANAEESTRPEIKVSIPKPLKLWSPDSPFLYDMKVYVVNGTTVVDSISTYFGMRKISKQMVDGYPKMMLNNEFLFHMGPLDQGFWPDGVYTAPTDEALKFDIVKTKELGFNMIRKHIKVEPQRWYYWCDKLGILVWQDMPSMNSYIDTRLRPVPQQERDAYKSELERMIRTHWNSPSIVVWVPFNEFQGSHNEAGLSAFVKTLDNSRLVNINSGGDSRYGTILENDIRDYHNYPPPVAPKPNATNSQILVCGEYGGVGYYEKGHIWQEGNPYETVPTYAMLLDRFSKYGDMLVYFKSNKGLSGAVYTEITDVEMELNGFLTYDRKVEKGNFADFYAVNQRVIHDNDYFNDIAITSEETKQIWKYTTTTPVPSLSWYKVDFDDSSWQTGEGGFGTDKTPGARIGTVWNTNNIWMRRNFYAPANALENGKLMLRVHHDEDCKVYINGVLALDLPGYTGDYNFYEATPAAQSALNLGGQNTLAVYCKQTTGGQYIDVGVYTKLLNDQSGTNNLKKKAYRIYPNPVRYVLNVDVQEGSVIDGVYGVLGDKVMSQQFAENIINVSSLPAGIYFLRINETDSTTNIKFIKK
ncbi:hypothetical protein MASR2M117_07960 [Paludibacter sp.]